MDRVKPASKVRIACDLLLAGRATATGVTNQTAKTQEKYWRKWCEYCEECDIDPFLHSIERVEHPLAITGFAARVRTGAYGLGNQVGVQTVSNALAAISKTIELACQQSPVYKEPGKYILPVERCLEGFRRQDPPSVPQLAVPVTVPEESAKRGWASNNPHRQAVGDLSLIAYYYMLRSGEYTKPRTVRQNGIVVPATRTRQFRVQDIGFWKAGKQLSRYSNLTNLLAADAASQCA